MRRLRLLRRGALKVRGAETDSVVTAKNVAEEMEENGKDGTRERHEINEK
jgi:hypothetical protein